MKKIEFKLKRYVNILDILIAALVSNILVIFNNVNYSLPFSKLTIYFIKALHSDRYVKIRQHMYLKRCQCRFIPCPAAKKYLSG